MITKKRAVLLTLFIVPLLFFLFLSTGVNNFKRLPVLTENIQFNNSEFSKLFDDKVTVLVFLGNDTETVKGAFFNLNEKIYKEFYGYQQFQLIAVYPSGSDSEKLKKDLGAFTDMSKWNFVPLEETEIRQVFNSLQTTSRLENSLFVNKAFLIDKAINLRGRNADKEAENGMVYGYLMSSVAELRNKMQDDIEVLLYEYRAAFKNKNKAKRINN